MAWTKYAEALRTPSVRNNVNEHVFRKRALAEAQGVATWARYSQDLAGKGDLTIEVDIDAAIAAAFALS